MNPLRPAQVLALALLFPLLAAGRTVEGQLTAGDATEADGAYGDTYQFTGRAGESVTVDLRSNDFDPYLRVRAPDGRTFANDDFNESAHHSRLELTLSAAGTYEVTVTSFEKGETGTYRLDLPGANTASELRTVSGRLEAGDETLRGGEFRDQYVFEGRVGQRVAIDLRSSDFDPYLLLRAPSGAQQENDDFSGSSQRSRIEFTLQEAGRHTITVTSFTKGETGGYTLEYPADPAVTATSAGAQIRRERGRLESGDETLTSGEYRDRFTVNGTAGERVVIDLRSETFDPYLILRKPDGSQDSNDDHEGSSSWSQIATTLPASGAYTVSVTTYKAGESGDYELVITRPGASTGPQRRVETGRLAAGDSTLTSGEYVDQFTVTAVSGQRVTLDVTSSEFDTYLILKAPSGESVQNDDHEDSSSRSRIEHVAAEAGEYTAMVTSYKKAETGAYRLELLVDSAAPVRAPTTDLIAIAPGQSRSGRLAAGDLKREDGELADLYGFEGTEGQTVSIDLRASDFDTFLVVVTPSGRTIENDDYEGSLDRSRIDLPINESGRYRIYATSYDQDGTGAYELSLRTIQAPAAPVAAAATGSGTIFGIFVGVAQYQDPDDNLDLTDQDAVRMRDAMVQSAGMPAGNAILLQNAGATRQAFENAMRSIAGRATARDTLVVFFSGHGSRYDRRAGPDNFDPDGKDESIEFHDRPLLDDEMARLLDAMPAGRQLLVLDSCFSGGFAKDVISKPGRMGMFSSEEDVTSAVAKKFLAGGYLAKFFCDSILMPYADQDKDGSLTALELSYYIGEQYRSEVKAGPRPDIVVERNLSYQKLVVDRGSIGPYDVVLRRR